MLRAHSKEKSVHAFTVIAAILPLAAGLMLSTVFMLDFIA